MIYTISDYKQYLYQDTSYYHQKKKSLVQKVYCRLIRDNVYWVRRYMICLRRCEYLLNNSYRNTKKHIHLWMDMAYLLEKRKLNNLSIKLGLEIYENSCDSGLTIYHTGGTVINPNARIGKNCKLYGNNCIGNNGESSGKCPVLGDNVRLGVGAKIIGDVFIADNITIAAGAIVVNSFKESNIVVAGVPAKKVGKK